jgi:hypothetical protein
MAIVINNYADYLTRIRNCATGNTVGDFDIAGLTTEYPQENRIIANGGRYLNTLVSNQGRFHSNLAQINFSRVF